MLRIPYQTTVHLNALHTARKAFVKAETSERIRRALRHKVRVADKSSHLGDKIFYKRNYDNRWRGQAKVRTGWKNCLCETW